MKTYYYNLRDHSWDEMQMVNGERTVVDDHVRIPKDWTTMIMPIEVWKAYINVILGYKDLTTKRINIWQSFYKDYHVQCNVNGFIRCLVEGETIIIESLDKYWEPCLRICI